MRPLLPRLALALLASACSGDIGTTDGGEDAATSDHHVASDAAAADASYDAFVFDGSLGIVCTGTSPSFTSDVHPIFKSCAGELCHGGTLATPWPYSALVNVPATRDQCAGAGMIVVPSSVDTSYLMKKLTGIDTCPTGTQMPPYASLPAAQIQTIADWICQGAPNN